MHINLGVLSAMFFKKVTCAMLKLVQHCHGWRGIHRREGWRNHWHQMLPRSPFTRIGAPTAPTLWWFQPIWKICSSNWIISPCRNVGVKIKNVWNHHLGKVQPNILDTYIRCVKGLFLNWLVDMMTWAYEIFWLRRTHKSTNDYKLAKLQITKWF